VQSSNSENADKTYNFWGLIANATDEELRWLTVDLLKVVDAWDLDSEDEHHCCY